MNISCKLCGFVSTKLFQIFILLNILIQIQCIDIYKNSYNNLDQAHTFYKRTSQFNESAYYNDCHDCGKKEIPEDCYQQLNKKYRSQTVLWKPNTEKLDCNYEIFSKNLTTHYNNELSFDFTIKQSNCLTNINMLGGTNYEVFAHDDDHLANCHYFDENNNNYTINCIIPKYKSKKYCIKLSVYVMYEHFDSYSEILIEKSNEYPSKRQTIIENQLYCFKQIISQNKILLNWLYDYNIIVYSGIWREQAAETSWYENGLKSNLFITEFQYNYPNNEKYQTIHQNLNNFTLNSYIYPPNKPDSYKFQPTMIQQTNKQTNSIIKTYLTIEKSLNFTLNNEINYIFIGSSHMRYNFDSILTIFHNKNSLNNIERKHNSLMISNFHFFSEYFAKHIAKRLLILCENWNTENSNSLKHIILLQTGSWDLFVTSSRRYLKDNKTLQLLINIIINILNYTLKCNNLIEIIWLTSVPYPLCTKYNHKSCDESKGYRTNSAIEASNQYILQSILQKLSKKIHIKFTIIDSYDIIYPRLGWNEDNEVTCLMHYICRLYPNRPDEKDVVLYTPAGNAVLQTILIALSN